MIKPLYWIIGNVLILFLIVAFAGMNQPIEDSPQVISSVEKEVLSVDPDFQLETSTKVTNMYSLSISTLLTGSEQMNQSIQTWLKREEDRFLAYVENNQKMFSEDQRAQLHIHMNMNKVTNDLYSVTFDLNQGFNETKQRKVIKTFNLDLVENKIMLLTDVLDLDESSLSDIRSIIKKQLNLDEKGVDEWLEKSLENPNQLNWLISQNALTFYFDDPDGPVTVDVPVEDLVSFLKETIITRLNIRIVQEEAGLDPNGKYIALTFDDGPSPGVTPRILEILKGYEAKATFFMVGSQVEYHPVLAKQVAAEGHEIGNHTGSHPNLTKLSEEQMRQEIEGASRTIEAVVGQYPTYFRPPYGAYNELVEKMAFELDSRIILWSVDSLDWKNRDAEAVKNLVLAGATPGSIVLLHDIHPTTADALPAVMTVLKNEGYQFVTVSELLTVQETN